MVGLIMKRTGVSNSYMPSEIEIGGKYVIDLQPTYQFLTGLSIILMILVGSVVCGCGISYADTRQSQTMSVSKGASEQELALAKATLEEFARLDVEAEMRRNKAPFPPAGMIMGGISMAIVGAFLGLKRLGYVSKEK